MFMFSDWILDTQVFWGFWPHWNEGQVEADEGLEIDSKIRNSIYVGRLGDKWNKRKIGIFIDNVVLEIELRMFSEEKFDFNR